MMNRVPKIVALLGFLILAGCSFHSAQWESAKALWSLWDSNRLTDKETYWWDMSYEGKTYRLFPVLWKDKIVLTDANRWMVVLRITDILMIRDSLENQQTSFEYSAESREEELPAMVSDDGPAPSLAPHEEGFGHTVAISIVEAPTGQFAISEKTVVSCDSPKFNRQTLGLVRMCSYGEEKTALSMVRFDHSGNINGLDVRTPSGNRWSVRRTQDLVGARDVKRYLLEGIVDAD
jgi:hypothetical protein